MTLIRGGRPETVASTEPLALLMDGRQYDGGTGPRLTAARTGTLVSLADAGAAVQYPEFAEAARTHRVGSSLSVPVALPEPVSAGLNLYSEQLDGFPQQDVELARTLAAYAAVALSNVHLYDSQQRVAEHLEVAQAIVDGTSGSAGG